MSTTTAAGQARRSRAGRAVALLPWRAGRARPEEETEVLVGALRRWAALVSAGLTEEQACARGDVDVYATTFRPMRSMFAGSDAKVMMKLLVDPETDRVLGCHIFAPEAGEMIHLSPTTLGLLRAADFSAAPGPLVPHYLRRPDAVAPASTAPKSALKPSPRQQQRDLRQGERAGRGAEASQ